MGALAKFRLNSDAPALYALAFLAPIFGAVAPLLIWIPALVAALVVASHCALSGGFWPPERPALVAILLGVIIWAATSTLWALDASRSLETVGKFVLVATALVILINAAGHMSMAERGRFRQMLINGTVACVVLTLLAIAVISGYIAWVQQAELTTSRFAVLNRTSSIIVILAWPVGLGIVQIHGRIAAASFFALTVAAVFLLEPATPKLAVMVGGGAFALAWWAPLLARLSLLAAFTIFIAIVPFLDAIVPWAKALLSASFHAPISEVHRLVIWQFVAEHIIERPLFGWGLEASRVFPGGDAELFLFASRSGDVVSGPALPLHPHNAVMQIWLELGLVGLALFGALFVLLVRAIGHISSSRTTSAVAVATVATGFINAQFGYGIWQGWWLTTLGIAAVITAAVIEPSPAAGKH